MKVLGVIPSRYQSSRFPGKPLANILGKSMIQRVYEQCMKCPLLNDVIIATDDDRILNHVQDFDGKAIMTSVNHASGTERCNEILQNINQDYDITVNIQGDEPYINPNQITQVINLLYNSTTEITTLARQINDIDLIHDINTPKTIFDKNGFALDFCRQISDFSSEKTYYQHIGIYAYQTHILPKLCELAPTKKEKQEALEQLRWLENDYTVKVGITVFKSFSVDIPDDIIQIEARMR